jgi:hypothetical protein
MFEIIVEALCKHLKLLDLDATIVKFNEGLFVGKGTGNYTGAVKVANRNIDLVELHKYEKDVGWGDIPSFITMYGCTYVIWAKVEGIEDKVKARLKSSRKHFSSNEIVDFWWDGNELAQALNSDTDLKDRLNNMIEVI